MVNRYEPNFDKGGGAHRSESGRFVRYSDYAELEAENERKAECIQQCLEMIATRDEALSRTGAVKAKALEWEETYDTTLAGGVIAEAESVLGDYRAWGSGLWRGPLGGNSRHQGDLQTAKAAAQADYEQRILSALEPAAPEGQQEAENPGLAGARALASERLASVADVRIPGGPTLALTSPAEQAVTEAMVEAAIAAMFHGHGWFPPPYAMRAALKAAMEAGRHD